MKCTLSLVSASLAILTTCVTAQLRVANSSRPFPSSTGASGPFDLFHTYPLYIANNVPQNRDHINCPSDHSVDWRSNAPGSLVGNIPVYTIYYGSGISDSDRNHVDNFVGNIKNNPIWNIVTARGGGRPYFAKRYNVRCDSRCSSVHDGCFPCSFSQWNENSLLNTFFERVSGRNIKGFGSIYVLVLGTDVTYTFTQGGNRVMGSSQLCATHDRSKFDGGSGYPYITVQAPKSRGSPCNFLASIGNPNNDYQLDNLIATLFHELVEAVIPPFRDDCSYEVADKCANRILNAGTQGRGNANVNVGGSRYVINPLWDNEKRICSMG